MKLDKPDRVAIVYPASTNQPTYNRQINMNLSA